MSGGEAASGKGNTMNEVAERHLVKASEYISRGDEFYRRAAEEMKAAMDAGATSRQVAERVQRSKSWVTELVQKLTSGQDLDKPWAEDTPARKERQVKQVLRDSEPEQLVSYVQDPEVRRKVREAVVRADQAEREEVGDDAVDKLNTEQALREAEAAVGKWYLQGKHALRLLNESEPSALSATWRSEFLKTLDEIQSQVEMAKGVLGGSVSDRDLEGLLA